MKVLDTRVRSLASSIMPVAQWLFRSGHVQLRASRELGVGVGSSPTMSTSQAAPFFGDAARHSWDALVLVSSSQEASRFSVNLHDCNRFGRSCRSCDAALSLQQANWRPTCVRKPAGERPVERRLGHVVGDCFNVMAIRIEDKSCIVILAVMRAQPGGTIVLATVLERGIVEARN